MREAAQAILTIAGVLMVAGAPVAASTGLGLAAVAMVATGAVSFHAAARVSA